MGKDITGETIRNYTVLRRLPNHIQPSGTQRVVWEVQCKCGHIKSIQQQSLLKGKSVYCEKCPDKQGETKENIIGNKYNQLTVLERAPNTRDKTTTRVNYLCKCDCGNETIVESGKLKSGHTKSCGCIQKKKLSRSRSKNMLGFKVGMLTVVSYYKKDKGQNHWLCECECGGEKILTTRALTAGKTQSCGCLSSVAEQHLKQYLEEHQITYKQQVKFENCRYKRELPFDFGIYEDGELKFLVELQGQQHYYPFTFCSEDKETKKNNLKELQKRDKIKRKFCKDNDIPLLEIPYNKFDKKEQLVHNQLIHTNDEQLVEI